MKNLKRFAVAFGMVAFLGAGSLISPEKAGAQSKEYISGGSGTSICYSSSRVRVGYTYYDCGSCSKIMDEKGKGNYTKC